MCLLMITEVVIYLQLKILGTCLHEEKMKQKKTDDQIRDYNTTIRKLTEQQGKLRQKVCCVYLEQTF